MSADLRIGDGLDRDEGVMLGYRPSRAAATALTLGAEARLGAALLSTPDPRSATTSTGHHVVVREGTRIGDEVSVWSNTVVDYGCIIGSRVKIHCNCYLAQFTELEDDVSWPLVTVANDLFPGQPVSARAMAGPPHTGWSPDRGQRHDPAVRHHRGWRHHRRGFGGHQRRPPGRRGGNPAVPGRRVEELQGLEARLRAHTLAWRRRRRRLHGRPPVARRSSMAQPQPSHGDGQRSCSMRASPPRPRAPGDLGHASDSTKPSNGRLTSCWPASSSSCWRR